MALYNNIPDAVISCGNASCHGPNPNDNINGLQKGANNPGVIETAIRTRVPQMMFLTGLLNPFQLDDLAAYIAPQPSLSGNALDFGAQTAGTTSGQQAVTLRSIGGVNLGVTGITVSGPNATDFVGSGSCTAGSNLLSTTIAQAGGSCNVSVAFHPSAAGPRSATIRLSYAGASTFPGTQTIALTGLGTVAPAPLALIDPPSIDFGEVARGATSPQRTITVANPGNAPLVVSSLDLTGQHAAEFSLSGTCLAGALPFQVSASGSCNIVVEFSPQGLNFRTADLRIQHNAPANPGLVGLSGYSAAATCAPPPPTEFQTLACPAGQSGTISQLRDAVCIGTTWSPGPWVTIANNCHSNYPAPSLNLVEYFNAGLNHYFMTADPAERQVMETGGAGSGWARTLSLGRVWGTAPGSYILPLCRFYGNPALGPEGRRRGPNSHFFTLDPDECAAVNEDAGWIFEGIVFQAAAPNRGACPQPLVPVYRSYNGRYLENDSNHRYATDLAIVQQMSVQGWVSEGVVFCVAPE